MVINSFPATDNMMSDVAIGNFQSIINEQGYLYIEELCDNFDHLAFAEKFGTLIPHKYNNEYIFSIKVEPKLGERCSAGGRMAHAATFSRVV